MAPLDELRVPEWVIPNISLYFGWPLNLCGEGDDNDTEGGWDKFGVGRCIGEHKQLSRRMHPDKGGASPEVVLLVLACLFFCSLFSFFVLPLSK
jgi:hypothetical protein